MRKFILGALTLGILSTVACGKQLQSEDAATQEAAQNIGDIMASIDEAGGSNSNGSYALKEAQAAEKMFARLAPKKSLKEVVLQKSVPRAEAATCGASTFGSCTNNVITRNFNNCTLGNATLSGTVSLTFNDGNTNNDCTVDSTGDSITRNPNFTVTGLYGGELTVSKTSSYGQKLTYNGGSSGSATFTFENDGIRRAVTFASRTLYDSTTSTTGPLTLVGMTRAGRTLTSSGGAAVRVLNNETNVSCDFVPSAVTWASTCTCATSGSWTATCSDGKSATLNITGCGSGTYSIGGGTSSDVSFDRCSSI